MNRPPVDQRIEGALQLQAMTVAELSRCLSLDLSTVRKSVRAMRYERRVSARTKVSSLHGRPWVVYALRGLSQAQKGEVA